MKYPNHKDYTKLYGRYLKKGPERFFVKSDPNGKRVLDLCCGGGQLSTYALEHGANKVVMIDSCYDMRDPKFNGMMKTVHIVTDVEGYLRWCKDEPFDIMVCRQGTNYWFKHIEGECIANAVKSGGMFVFNTFGNKPTEAPMIKEYYHGGIKYKEVSFLFDGRVHHVQTAQGLEPHMTVFDWISREEYMEKLSPYFNIEEVVDGPSSMWFCTKK